MIATVLCCDSAYLPISFEARAAATAADAFKSHRVKNGRFRRALTYLALLCQTIMHAVGMHFPGKKSKHRKRPP